MRRYILLLIIPLLFVSGLNQCVTAAEFRKISEPNKIIEENIEDDFYVTGEDNLIIKGNIKGDLIVIGGNVEVRGKVGGDLYVAAGSINVENAISGSVMVVGGQLRIKGSVERNIFAAGGNITVDGEVGEDLLLLGGQLVLNGKVKDDVRIAGGNAQLNGETGDDLILAVGNTTISQNVGGDVYAADGNLNITAQKIGGDLIFYGHERNLITTSDLEIGGVKQINEPQIINKSNKININPAEAGMVGLILRAVWNIVQIVGLIMTGFVLIKLAPIKTIQVVENMRGIVNHLKSLGIGCIGVFITIPFILILILSIIGIPLAKLLIALGFLAMAIITPISGIALGRFFAGLFKQKENYLFVLLAGVVIIQLIKIVPIAGDIIGIYIFFLVIGAILRFLYQKLKTNSKL